MKTNNQKIGLQSFAKLLVYSGMFLLSIFVFISCGEETPEVINEDELITTVIMTLNTSSQSILLNYTDLDGDGPSAPVFSVSEKLNKNTVYTGKVSFFNELVNPAENISEEVFNEALKHQVFYLVPAAFGTFDYLDQDSNGKPLGLDFTFTTGADPKIGNLTVILRHEPNKLNPGVADGDISNAGGSTDIQATFPIQIQ